MCKCNLEGTGGKIAFGKTRIYAALLGQFTISIFLHRCIQMAIAIRQNHVISYFLSYSHVFYFFLFLFRIDVSEVQSRRKRFALANKLKNAPASGEQPESRFSIKNAVKTRKTTFPGSIWCSQEIRARGKTMAADILLQFFQVFPRIST